MKSIFKLFGALSIVALVAAGCADPVSVSNSSDEVALGKRDIAAGQQTMSIVDIASGNTNFSSLVAAVSKLGLVDTLSNYGQFTVFAPTNAAFDTLLARTPAWSTLDDIPIDVLAQVVTYHVVDGRQFSNSVLKKKKLETLQGQYIYVKERGSPVLIDATGQEVTIDTVTPLFDIPATNGVVHAVDRVLLPDLN